MSTNTTSSTRSSSKAVHFPADLPEQTKTTHPSHTKNRGPKPYQPANICIKKGKWYDCLRPVPGYQDFGGIGAGNAKKEDDEEEIFKGKVQDYRTMKPSLFGNKNKKVAGK